MTDPAKTLLGRAADWILEQFGYSTTDAEAKVDADAAKFDAEAKVVITDIEAAFKPVIANLGVLSKSALQIGVAAGLGALQTALATKSAPSLCLPALAARLPMR